jgi:hypothetical protein
MSIKFKNILIYIVYFFILVLGYHVIKNIITQKKLNSQNALENNIDSTQVTYDVPYVLDSYDPRFIAPRYYDTQFLVYEQPVYARNFGYYPVRHRIREHSHRPRFLGGGGGGWRSGSRGGHPGGGRGGHGHR